MMIGFYRTMRIKFEIDPVRHVIFTSFQNNKKSVAFSTFLGVFWLNCRNFDCLLFQKTILIAAVLLNNDT